jgi:hypothetical protein
MCIENIMTIFISFHINKALKWICHMLLIGTAQTIVLAFTYPIKVGDTIKKLAAITTKKIKKGLKKKGLIPPRQLMVL